MKLGGHVHRHLRQRLTPGVLSTSAIWLTPGPTVARVFWVDSAGAPAHFSELQDALDVASWGDVIRVGVGVHYLDDDDDEALVPAGVVLVGAPDDPGSVAVRRLGGDVGGDVLGVDYGATAAGVSLSAVGRQSCAGIFEEGELRLRQCDVTGAPGTQSPSATAWYRGSPSLV